MEAPRIKTAEEIALEKELVEVREDTRLAKEELKRAEEALKIAEKREGPSTSKTKKVVQAVTAAALLASGGYGAKKGADALNWGVKDPHAAKSTQKYTPEMQASYMAEAEKVHKEIVELQEKKIAARERDNAQFAANKEADEKLKELQQKLDEAERETQEKSAEAKKATEKITEEMKAKDKAAKELAELQQRQLNELKERLQKMQTPKTAPLASINSRTVETPKNIKEKKPQDEIPESLKREGIKVTSGSADSGGYNVIHHSNPQGLSFNKAPELVKNPFGLDPKTLEEKIDKVYQNNIDKWNTNTWSNIKDEKASSFIKKKFNEKKEKEEKAIQEYVLKIKKISGLEPEKEETVDHYIYGVLRHEILKSEGLERLQGLEL